ncbi:MAG TPA: periplasmic heavy metal sensor [Nitrospirota bacterium]|nr:periplasmic heavy metal sensor [Nitrospirota bacterium]
MKMRNWLIIIVALSFIISFAGGAMADEGYKGYNMSDMKGDDNVPPCMKSPGMMGGPGMMHHKMGKSSDMMSMPPGMYSWEDLQEKLELNEEQAEKFRKIYSEYRKEVMKRRVEIEIAEMDLMELLRSTKASDKAIEDAAGKIQSSWSSLNTYRVKALLKTRSFLSDKQYQELLNHFMDRRGSQMGGWGYGWH